MSSVILYEISGHIVAWNHQAETLYGWSYQEAVKMNMFDLIPESEHSSMQSFIDNVVSGNSTTQGITSTRITKQNTEPLAVELKGRLVDNRLFKPHGQRKKSCLLINVMEVGRRREAEEELKLAAEVFESSEEGIMIVDTDCKILKVNFSLTAITGYVAVEAIGKTPRILKSGRHSSQFY